MALTTAPDLYFDPYDVEITANPYPVLRRLREEAPLYYNERYDFYALSRYDDIEQALKDKDTFINGKGNVLELIKADVEQPPGTLIFEDPPAHTLHRKLLSRAFTPKRVSALEQQIRDFTAECLDPLVGADGFDFVADLGAQVPMQVIGMLMGIPEAGPADGARTRRRLPAHRAGPAHALLEGIEVESGLEALGHLRRVHRLARRAPVRRRHDRRCCRRRSRTSTASPGRLTRDEALLYVNIVAGAGNETTNRLIGWTGKVLGDHPDQRRQIVEDPALVDNAIEELLRFETPGPITGRYVAKDVELHGQIVPAGSALLLLNHSANRDERRFPDPDRFDIHRTIGQHLTFGHGIHFCLGASLTRLEGRVVARRGAQAVPGLGGRHRQRTDGVRLGGPGLADAPGVHAVTGNEP